MFGIEISSKIHVRFGVRFMAQHIVQRRELRIFLDKHCQRIFTFILQMVLHRKQEPPALRQQSPDNVLHRATVSIRNHNRPQHRITKSNHKCSGTMPFELLNRELSRNETGHRTRTLFVPLFQQHLDLIGGHRQIQKIKKHKKSENKPLEQCRKTIHRAH